MNDNNVDFYESGQITVRLSPETHNLLRRFFPDLFGYEPTEEHPVPSGKQLFDVILRKAISCINIDPKDLEQMGSLQNANVQLDARNRELESLNDQLRHQIEEMREAQPGELQTIINLNPAIADLLDQCVNRATLKSKKDFTREDIFLNLFWEAVTTGRASLPIIFSSSEVAAIIKKHKPQE